MWNILNVLIILIWWNWISNLWNFRIYSTSRGVWKYYINKIFPILLPHPPTPASAIKIQWVLGLWHQCIQDKIIDTVLWWYSHIKGFLYCSSIVFSLISCKCIICVCRHLFVSLVYLNYNFKIYLFNGLPVTRFYEILLGTSCFRVFMT